MEYSVLSSSRTSSSSPGHSTASSCLSSVNRTEFKGLVVEFLLQGLIRVSDRY